jgi:cobalamin biosynthetic protein CobC
MVSRPQHGGDLQRALHQYGGTAEQWLDLSAAISPWAYPHEWPPAEAGHHLPQTTDAVYDAIQANYQPAKGWRAEAVAGSQAVIQWLPWLHRQQYRGKSNQVWLLAGSYGEHAWRWSLAGFEVCFFTLDALVHALAVQAPPAALVLVNPDNPSGQLWSATQLWQWQQQLEGGWLVVDEAFMDVWPQHSLLHRPACDGVFVLRSLGKFFGLAGWRLGVCFASARYIDLLCDWLGPWAVNGPGLAIMQQALLDDAWQQQQRQRLLSAQQRMQRLLDDNGYSCLASQPLFVTLQADSRLQQRLAEQHIWSRYFAEQQRVRLGWPGTEPGWQRLGHALGSQNQP